MSEKPRFRIALDSQHVKGSETLLESAGQHFYHIISSLWQELSCKIYLLVVSEILGMFVNTLSPDDKYSFGNWENFLQPIEMQLS